MGNTKSKSKTESKSKSKSKSESESKSKAQSDYYYATIKDSSIKSKKHITLQLISTTVTNKQKTLKYSFNYKYSYLHETKMLIDYLVDKCKSDCEAYGVSNCTNTVKQFKKLLKTKLGFNYKLRCVGEDVNHNVKILGLDDKSNYTTVEYCVLFPKITYMISGYPVSVYLKSDAILQSELTQLQLKTHGKHSRLYLCLNSAKLSSIDVHIDQDNRNAINCALRHILI